MRKELNGKFEAIKRISISGRQPKQENLHTINNLPSKCIMVPCPSSKSSLETLLPEGTIVNKSSAIGDGIVYFDQILASVESSHKSLVRVTSVFRS